jgi:subtilisin family serine protease
VEDTVARKKAVRRGGRRGARSSGAEGPRAVATAAAGSRAVSDVRLECAVVYIHGIGNQGTPEALKRDWDTALFGQAMADTDMAFWSDIRHPPAPAGRTRARTVARDAALGGAKAREYMRAVGERLGVRDAGARAGVRARVLPWLPGIGDALFEWISKGFIKDTAAYFFDPAQRRAMQDRLKAALARQASRPVVLVAHSQGTIIAYDVLRQLDGRAPGGGALDVRLFVTLGSPLGIDEVQGNLVKPIEAPEGVAAWVNLADRLDPVALDADLDGEFPGLPIEDLRVKNPVLFNPHSAVGYLSTSQVRSTIYGALNWNHLGYGRRVRKDVLKELVEDMARREIQAERPEQRHPVLIELRDPAGFGAAAFAGLAAGRSERTLAEHTEDVVAFLEQNVADTKAARIDPLHRFVAASLTPSEIQRLETECLGTVYSVWKNARKRALIRRSADVVQAPAARAAYRADGQGVAWAVLDTGVESDHPHFHPSPDHATVAKVWDCTRPGPPKSMLEGRRGARDAEGHGTHVCGIIAGEERDGAHKGLAPRARLHVYKVLDDQGFGEDGWIIKAIQHISRTNAAAADLVVHGVNLSLGGPFDPEVYGCGHSPICQELRRLWRQGVVVCVACGNEGALDVTTPDGTATLNTFLSIGDPANLDDCVAVGSVHADQPHFYGISHFSSRGPTADGRAKPDLVAPGERIESCNSGYALRRPATHYVALSGTSMAAPHVSGLLAAFLSVRREFIGRPDELKRILVAQCTDLGRDRYLQGAGLPNLVKMLANT